MKRLEILDIGSGPWPKADATIRMDINDFPGVTLKHSVTDIPYPLEDGVCGKVYMGDVIEHINVFDVVPVLKEIHRIMAPGATLHITCPDVQWIAERIANKDWEQAANVNWLNPTESPWFNAMQYLFGGWCNEAEKDMPGMGHVFGYNQEYLTGLLQLVGFEHTERHPDMRNPEPARNSILYMVAKKGE